MFGLHFLFFDIGRRYRIAPFWRRLVAEFIDFLLMLVLSNLLLLFLIGQLPIFECVYV